MDTNKLKKFAVDARNKIRHGVEAKLSTLGFDSKGNVPDSMKPQLMQGGSLWNGQLMTESFYHQWMALYEAVKSHGVHHIYEEAAYTWFNRLVAIRILQKNGIIEPVLSYADEARTPKIVDDARSVGRIPPMPEADRQRLMELLDDDTKVTEQFAILITAYCHDNPVIRQSFGRMADYTELLLPNNILAEGGFIDDLNHTEFITDDDYKSSELIGWLYQFYISERKDEVFAKKGKYDADEIAPATQIFTPHWIVEYMVQNTIGRIYLDNHLDDADTFKPKWKYLVDQEQRDDDHIYHFNELTDLRFADLGCGSGHILGYMFDILFDLYIYEGYTRKEAVENILRYNITGVDIDLRAKQLATFALLLKACQKDESFKDGNVLPNVLTMPEPIPESDRHQLFHEFFKGEETNNILAELDDAFDLLKDAQTLGSIMKFDLSKSTLLAIKQTMDYWKDKSIVPDSVTRLLPSFRIILALTQKYTALVMNPPYMGSGRFDSVLSKYVKDNYASGKADLFAVFMLVAQQRLVPNGKYAMINMQSWMFLSSFEQLRKNLLDTMQIDSMLHLGPHTFDELNGEVVQNTSFVVSNLKPKNAGIFYRLVNGKNCTAKELMFLMNIISNDNEEEKVFYPNVRQRDFEKIPGSPIGYWLSEKEIECFDLLPAISEFCHSAQGLATTDNNRFVRLWQEVDFSKISFNCKDRDEAIATRNKWFPFNKGGNNSRWYGCQFYIVNWQNDGEEIKNNVLKKYPYLKTPDFVVKNQHLYFHASASWSKISSSGIGFRYFPQGFIFADAGMSLFSERELTKIMSYVNSIVCREFMFVLSPTLNYEAGQVAQLPFKDYDNKELYIISRQNITLSKLDWDSHETSWDFKGNPLVEIMGAAASGKGFVDEENEAESHFDDADISLRDDRHAIAERPSRNSVTTATEFSGDRHASLQQPCNDITKPLYDDYNALVTSLQGLCNPTEGVRAHGSTLETAVKAFEKLWEARFYQLHANEEELNRQFIDIYGLQDELTPDVPLDEITILQQNEIAIKDGQIEWNKDTLIKQLISYDVGVCMGRYRLDKPGLHIAYPKPSAEDLAAYNYNGNNIVIDDDGIIPLLPHDSPFSDNMVNRLSDFIRIVFGEDYLAENLNFMERCLDETLEKYLQKDFWKDHKKMYQNRPIYWLFSSKKGAFQCIAYMHRMDAYTAERVRSKYLLPYIDSIQRKIEALDSRSAELSTAESRQRDQLRKALDECREYHDRLQVVADQAISFDLDDGVVVNYAKFGDVLSKIK